MKMRVQPTLSTRKRRAAEEPMMATLPKIIILSNKIIKSAGSPLLWSVKRTETQPLSPPCFDSDVDLEEAMAGITDEELGRALAIVTRGNLDRVLQNDVTSTTILPSLDEDLELEEAMAEIPDENLCPSEKGEEHEEKEAVDKLSVYMFGIKGMVTFEEVVYNNQLGHLNADGTGFRRIVKRKITCMPCRAGQFESANVNLDDYVDADDDIHNPRVSVVTTDVEEARLLLLRYRDPCSVCRKPFFTLKCPSESELNIRLINM